MGFSCFMSSISDFIRIGNASLYKLEGYHVNDFTKQPLTFLSYRY
jgi:hypothetical protein